MALTSDGRAGGILLELVRSELKHLGAEERTPVPNAPAPRPPAPTGPPATSVADLARVPWTFVALVPSEAHYDRAKADLVEAGGTVLAAKRGRGTMLGTAAVAALADKTAVERLVAVDEVLGELEECAGLFLDGPLVPTAPMLERHVERVHQAISALRYAVDGDPGHGDED